ncbi:MAG: hypothetical protein NZL85_08660, partial [Fimbriimonadales bacterium]|nr:hypothetical protein [Fimbriimonadales bacterium]
LDALEVMQKKQAHHLLLQMVQPHADLTELRDWQERIDSYLQLPPEEQEARLEELIPPLAQWVGAALHSTPIP